MNLLIIHYSAYMEAHLCFQQKFQARIYSAGLKPREIVVKHNAVWSYPKETSRVVCLHIYRPRFLAL